MDKSMFSFLRQMTRGIIVHVSQDLLCKQLNYDSNFSEFILLQFPLPGCR